MNLLNGGTDMSSSQMKKPLKPLDIDEELTAKDTAECEAYWAKVREEHPTRKINKNGNEIRHPRNESGDG
jgi:hypothetical protein